MQFYMPTELITGEHCVAEHASKLARYGKRCLIVTGGSAAARSGALRDAEEALRSQGISFTHYAGIEPNPTLASCQEGGRLANSAGAEFVLGIGGGSPLDAAKAVSVFAANPGMTEEVFYSAKWDHAPLPIVLIGTTAGTGSEVTSVSVLTDSAGKKHSIHDRRVYAALAMGDARYTMTLPRAATLSTGIDAICHCIESYFSKKADPFSRLFSVQGVRLGLPVLTRVAEMGAEEQPTLQQREALYQASILGGMAINPTGTVFPHNVGYYLTEHYPEAVAAWKRHLAYNPGSIATYYNIANAYAHLLNDKKQAAIYYRQFLDLARKEEKPTEQLIQMIQNAESILRTASQ